MVIGEDELSSDIEAGFYTANFVGVEVRTDSAELYENILHAEADEAESHGVFTYVTADRLPLPSATSDDRLRPASSTYPGEIYASHGLDRFYFSGAVKLGTLASMAYGIRALSSIDDGRLGLHTSLVYDREAEDSTLLVGRNRIGKSTIGQALEEADDRYVMLADDWSEVSLTDGQVTPVSPVFSTERIDDTYQLAFMSFGKPFYHRNLPELSTLPRLTLGRIIEVRDEIEQPDEAFLAESLAHIPLLRQPLDERTFVRVSLQNAASARVVERKLAAIKDGYQALAESYQIMAVSNNHGKDDFDTVVAAVRDMVEHS